MLGKLMKYEWRGLRFPLVIMFAILFSTTLLTCGVILTINPRYDEVVTNYSVLALILSIFLYYFGLIGCSVGTMLIIAIRFYKTCYTDQGYLTHTLPVSARQLFHAKALTAILSYILVFVGIIATIAIIISVAFNHIMNVSGYDIELFWSEFSELMSELSIEFSETMGISFGAYMTFMIIFMIISFIASIITVLGCVSLGQLYAKHRVLGAIIAYFAVQMINQFIGYLSIIPSYTKMFEASISYADDVTPYSLFSPAIIISLIFTVIIAVVMYFINIHMMTKKLNLE